MGECPGAPAPAAPAPAPEPEPEPTPTTRGALTIATSAPTQVVL
jgi:hypothetical protein